MEPVRRASISGDHVATMRLHFTCRRPKVALAASCVLVTSIPPSRLDGRLLLLAAAAARIRARGWSSSVDLDFDLFGPLRRGVALRVCVVDWHAVCLAVASCFFADKISGVGISGSAQHTHSSFEPVAHAGRRHRGRRGHDQARLLEPRMLCKEGPPSPRRYRRGLEPGVSSAWTIWASAMRPPTDPPPPLLFLKCREPAEDHVPSLGLPPSGPDRQRQAECAAARRRPLRMHPAPEDAAGHWGESGLLHR